MCKNTFISYSENILVHFFYYSTILVYILAGMEKYYPWFKIDLQGVEVFNYR